MLVYLSGGITNVPNYLERFSRAEELLNKRGLAAINPAKVNFMMPVQTTYDQYMQMSMTMLSFCSDIYMIEGWENSKGATWERDYAMRNGIEVHYLYEEDYKELKEREDY